MDSFESEQYNLVGAMRVVNIDRIIALGSSLHVFDSCCLDPPFTPNFRTVRLRKEGKGCLRYVQAKPLLLSELKNNIIFCVNREARPTSNLRMIQYEQVNCRGVDGNCGGPQGPRSNAAWLKD